MGTPDFAVPSLKILLDNGYSVVGVVTAPDKPGGRQGIQQSAVKLFALEAGLPLLQPLKFKDPAFLEALQALKADLQVVVAFRMLPEIVWSMPKMGTMNLHGSLLPKYRGAAPINWAIIQGEKETGVSTFLLQHEIDTGDLLFQRTMPIGENETAGELHDRMMLVGAELLLESVKALEAGAVKPMPQADIEATHAPKIHTDTCRINFDQPTESVHNFIRGLSPYPGAWTMLGEKVLKVLRTEKEIADGVLPKSGELVVEGKKSLKIGTNDGFVRVLELQLEGKRRMAVQEFLNGNPLLPNTIT
jgi:methionyl-tRNA formyltransferase